MTILLNPEVMVVTYLRVFSLWLRTYFIDPGFSTNFLFSVPFLNLVQKVQRTSSTLALYGGAYLLFLPCFPFFPRLTAGEETRCPRVGFWLCWYGFRWCQTVVVVAQFVSVPLTELRSTHNAYHLYGVAALCWCGLDSRGVSVTLMEVPSSSLCSPRFCALLLVLTVYHLFSWLCYFWSRTSNCLAAFQCCHISLQLLHPMALDSIQSCSFKCGV